MPCVIFHVDFGLNLEPKQRKMFAIENNCFEHLGKV